MMNFSDINQKEDYSDRQRNGMIIEKMVTEGSVTYLEATIDWLESNGLSEASFAKYIPMPIIDKITIEVQEYNLLRPSLLKAKDSGSLDFLM